MATTAEPLPRRTGLRGGSPGSRFAVYAVYAASPPRLHAWARFVAGLEHGAQFIGAHVPARFRTAGSCCSRA